MRAIFLVLDNKAPADSTACGGRAASRLINYPARAKNDSVSCIEASALLACPIAAQKNRLRPHRIFPFWRESLPKNNWTTCSPLVETHR
jgi:hypothetical protein